MKLLLILLVVGAALWLVRGLRTGSKVAAPQAQAPTVPAQRSGPVAMVSCAFCGLHLPRDEAFSSPSQHHYCSEAHRIEHLKQTLDDVARRAG